MVLLLMSSCIILTSNVNYCEAAARWDKKLTNQYIEIDSHHDIFQYKADSEYVDYENDDSKRYSFKKQYIDSNKSQKVYASVVDNGCIEEPYIWSDTECDGTFYTYTYSSDDKDKGYLVYDDAKGKNVFKLKLKKLNSVFRKNNIRSGSVVNVGRFDNKVIIIMVATVKSGGPAKIELAYSCAVYDLNKKKIVSNNILEKFSKAKDGFKLDNPQIDGRYVYFVEQSGDCKKTDKMKIQDKRKRAVVTYNYSGKRINKIDYSKYLKRYTKYYGSANTLYDSEECSICAYNGKVYVATRTGIYKCSSLGTKFEKVCDAKDTGLSNLAGYDLDFIYINEKELAYEYSTDSDCCEMIYLDNIVF